MVSWHICHPHNWHCNILSSFEQLVNSSLSNLLGIMTYFLLLFAAVNFSLNTRYPSMLPCEHPKGGGYGFPLSSKKRIHPCYCYSCCCFCRLLFHHVQDIQCYCYSCCWFRVNSSHFFKWFYSNPLTRHPPNRIKCNPNFTHPIFYLELILSNHDTVWSDLIAFITARIQDSPSLILIAEYNISFHVIV